MFHYVYITTVTTLGESFYYFGKHSTKNLHDGYKGSGTMIKSTLKHLDYLKQHDPDFTVENDVLCYFETAVDALEFEELLVEEAKEKFGCYCMNVAEGGIGDPTAYMSESEKKERGRKISESLKGRMLSEETRTKISKSTKNRKFSDETRRKLSISLSGREASENTKRILAKFRTDILPWNNGRIKNSIDIQNLWAQSDLIYDIWLETQYKDRNLLNECISRGLKISKSIRLQKMIKWFEKGNNPRDFDLPKREH